MSASAAHLRAAIDDLKRRRTEIDSAIASMETVLRTVYGVDIPEPPAAPFHTDDTTDEGIIVVHGRRWRSGPIPTAVLSRVDRVKAAFNERPDYIWDSASLAVEIGEPNVRLSAISAILSRMVDAGEIIRVGRGEYIKNASAPGATGAEEGGEPNRDSPLEEGGRHGSAPASGSGGGAFVPHNHLGLGDHRASLMEVQRSS